MTFNDYYNSTIIPKLKSIDLFIKTHSDDYVPIETTSTLLDISSKEVSDILKTNNLLSIDKNTFFIVMKEGSSNICQLFNRQLEIGYNSTYSPQDISYIYDIPKDIILKAMSASKIHIIDNNNLHALLDYIYIE